MFKVNSSQSFVYKYHNIVLLFILPSSFKHKSCARDGLSIYVCVCVSECIPQAFDGFWLSRLNGKVQQCYYNCYCSTLPKDYEFICSLSKLFDFNTDKLFCLNHRVINLAYQKYICRGTDVHTNIRMFEEIPQKYILGKTTHLRLQATALQAGKK